MNHWDIRRPTLVALVVVTALTFALKFYAGPGHWWVNDWGPASIGFELFFMLVLFLVWPRRGAVTPIAVTVCSATCAGEFLQLWQPQWLQTIRTTFLGKALLGTTFSWWDLPAYFIGCLCGWGYFGGFWRARGRSDSGGFSARFLVAEFARIPTRNQTLRPFRILAHFGTDFLRVSRRNSCSFHDGEFWNSCEFRHGDLLRFERVSKGRHQRGASSAAND